MADTPKPLPPSAILKLLRSHGPGAKVTIQPEHIAAFDAALTALLFQHQVKQLCLHGPSSPERAPRSQPAADTRQSTSEKNAKKEPNSPKPISARPVEGSGSIWTPDEQERLRAQWERGDAIGAIGEAHKRSASACFSRLIRIGAFEAGFEPSAALHLIKHLQLVCLSNRSEWSEKAASFGFDSAPPAAFAPRPPSP